MSTTESNFSKPHFGDIPLACVIPSKTPAKKAKQGKKAKSQKDVADVAIKNPVEAWPFPTGTKPAGVEEKTEEGEAA